MYLDEEQKIDFPIPELIRMDIEKLDNCFKQNDDLEFALHLEIFEATAKQAYINGNISSLEFNTLLRRYGLR